MDILKKLMDSTGKMPLKIGALANQPTNTNFQESTAFRLSIRKIPNTVYFCQSVSLPGLSIDKVYQDTPFKQINYPGTYVTMDDFRIKFLVAEDLSNWLEIYNWIRSCSTVKDFSEIVSLETSLSSDATLSLLSSKNNMNFNVRFTNLFPTSLGSIDFDYSQTDVTPISCDVTFAYTYYDVVT
jgi:hypothetical protein